MTKWHNISTAPQPHRCLWLRAALLILAGTAVMLAAVVIGASL